MKRLVVALVCTLLAALWIARSQWRDSDAATPASAQVAPEVSSDGSLAPVAPANSSTDSHTDADTAAERSEVAAKSNANSATPPAAPATLRVIAVAESDGAPIADEVVTVQPPGTTWRNEERLLARTNSDGVAVFERQRPGHSWVKLLRGGESGVMLRAGETTELRLRVRTGVTVTGSVVDREGAAVPGADIWLSERYRSNLGHIVAHADRGGRFEIEHVTADQSIGAQAHGYSPSSLRMLRGADGDKLAIELVLDRPGLRVRGIVRDDRGAQIADAQVMLGVEDPAYSQRSDTGEIRLTPPPLRTSTDDNGEFVVDGAAGGLQKLQVRARECAPIALEVATDNADRFPIEIVLPRCARVFGRAVDGEHRGLPSVWIHTGDPEHFASNSTYSGPDGRFELDGLPAGSVTVLAEHPGCGRTSLEVALQAGERREWNLVLAEQPRIFGRVVDERGAPLEGWTVVAVPKGDESRRMRSQRVEADGQFAIVGVADEPHVLWVQAPGAWRDLPALTRNDVRPSNEPLELRVPDSDGESGRIVARVLGPAGTSVAGARATLWHVEQSLWREFVVDGGTGALAIEHVPPGSCELRVLSPDFARRNLGRVAVRAGKTTDLGDIVLEEGGRLIVHLKGGDDALVAGMSAMIQDSARRDADQIRAEGREMRSGPLAPGPRRLVVSGDFVRTVELEVEIAAGVAREVDVEIERAGMRRIVFDPAEGSTPPQWINCVAFDASGATAWAGGCGARNGLEVHVSAPPGSYRFVARDGPNVVAERELAIGSLDEGEALHLALAP